MKATSAMNSATSPIVVPPLIVFLVLKLADLVDWSWWWVSAPLWGGFLVNAFGSLVIYAVSDKRKRLKR